MNTTPDPSFGSSVAPTPRLERSRLLWIVLGVVVGLVVGAAVVVGGGYVLLQAFNPVGDEYVCSEGETPGGKIPVPPGGGNDCYREGNFPRGYEADPLGNRPMSYNCDKDGYRLIDKTTGRGAGNVSECIADDTDIPDGWSLSDQD